MRKYVDRQHGDVEFQAGREFGPIDFVRILNEIRESQTPQFFGVKRGGSIPSNVEIREGVAYFGCADGNFYAVDAATGRELWRFACGEVVPAFCIGKDAMYVSCFDHSVYALGFDGKLIWKFQADGKFGNMPAEREGKVYVGCEDGNLYCLNAASGGLVWKFSVNSPVAAMPAICEGLVFFGDFGGSFHALNAETGALAWKFKAGGGLSGGLVYDGVIYLPCLNRTVYALSIDGKLLWSYKSDKDIPTNPYCTPYKGLIFLGGRESGMLALSTKTRKKAWDFRTHDMVLPYSATSDGVLYFGDCGNKFYAVNAETGRFLWSFSTNGPNVAGCSVGGGNVYFGSWDCNAYCLDAKTGELVWKFHTSMSTMSDYVVDTRADKPELSITIRLADEGKKNATEADAGLADYGEFSGAYIEKEKSDYVKSGKRGYVNKKEF